MPQETYQSVNSLSDLRKDHGLFAKYLTEIEVKSFIKKKFKGIRSIQSNEVPELPEGHPFLCPISHEMMQDPVMTQDGFTFDFENIKKWLQINKSNPLTRQPLTQEQLVRNTTLKKEMESWINGEITEESFIAQGGSKETWHRFKSISSKSLNSDPTLPFKRTTQGIPSDLLVKYHREVFEKPDKDSKEILDWYQELGMIEQKHDWCRDGTFCKSKIEIFEKRFLFDTDLEVETQLKILEVKNRLVYKHDSYDHDLIQALENNLKDTDQVKIKKLISYYLSESSGNIWWAQTDHHRQALLDKYATIFTGSYLKTIVLNSTRWTYYAISDALKLVIFCPERIAAYVNFVDNPSLENTKSILQSGLVFALLAILLEHSITIGVINYRASSEYGAFLKKPNLETWCHLIKANPGIVGFLSISLGHTSTRMLKLAINWDCHYGKIMSGNLQEAGKAFTEHPSVLGLLTLALKELGYNHHAGPHYAEFFKNPNAKTWCDLIKGNPGVIGALSIVLGCSALYTLKQVLKITVNWECHYGKIMSGNLQEAGKAFTEHPSVLGLLTLALKELGYNHHAGPQYAEFFKNPNAKTWCDLIQDNPGVITAISVALGYSAAQVLKLAINWDCHYGKIMFGNLQEAGKAFAEHPSALGLLALALKELGYNGHACPEYGAFLKKPNVETWCDLIRANPGIIGFLSISLGHTGTRMLKLAINWDCHYGKIMSGNLQEAGKAFAEHPSVLGLLTLALKELGYNHHAGPQYAEFFKNPSAKTWCDLIKSNPGVAGPLSIVLGCSTLYTLKQVLKITVNWECHYGKIMSGNLQEAGKAFAEHPSLLGLLTLALKELGYNHHAGHQYAEFFKNPNVETWCNLIRENPGIIMAISISLGYPITRLLKATTNWGCSYRRIMSGNLQEAGKAFAEHPSLLGLLAFTFKELGYNHHAVSEYTEFTKNPNVTSWCRLVAANPGFVAASIVTLFRFTSKGLRKILIDSEGMKIPFFEFLNEEGKDYFKILRDCDIQTNELFISESLPLENLNQVNENNYLAIKLKESQPSQDLIKALSEIDIKLPPFYSNIFSRYWDNPNSRNRNGLFFKGGVLAAGLTVSSKKVSSFMGGLIEFFRFDTPVVRRVDFGVPHDGTDSMQP